MCDIPTPVPHSFSKGTADRAVVYSTFLNGAFLRVCFIAVIKGSSAIKVLRRRDYPGGAARALTAALLRPLSSSSWRVR